jgi:hypothetical protein
MILSCLKKLKKIYIPVNPLMTNKIYEKTKIPENKDI